MNYVKSGILFQIEDPENTNVFSADPTSKTSFRVASEGIV